MRIVINNKKKYSAQVLPVVLVVLVVGVLIALQMMARTERQGDQVKEENFSATALEVADTGLDAVKGVDVTEFINTADHTFCTNMIAGQTFFEADGCQIRTWADFLVFVDKFGLEGYRDQIITAVKNECNEDVTQTDETNAIFSITIEPVLGEAAAIVEKDEVFSIMVLSPDVPPNCRVTVNMDPDGALVGSVLNPVYARVDGSGNITQFRDYDNPLFKGTCLTWDMGGDCASSWGENWQNSRSETYNIETADNYSMYELRIRAVGGNIQLAREYSPECGDALNGDMIRVTSEVNCNGQSRAKQFVLTREAWAPAIFDYVLFNGQGTLQIQ